MCVGGRGEEEGCVGEGGEKRRGVRYSVLFS